MRGRQKGRQKGDCVFEVNYDAVLADLPGRPGETDRERERRERHNRVNACLRHLNQFGEVRHDLIYGREPAPPAARPAEKEPVPDVVVEAAPVAAEPAPACGRCGKAPPTRADGLCSNCRVTLYRKERKERQGGGLLECGDCGARKPFHEAKGWRFPSRCKGKILCLRCQVFGKPRGT